MEVIKKYVSEIIMALSLIVLFLLFSGWHNQWGGKLSQEEIDNYIGHIEDLPLPEEEITAIVERLRPWAMKDDGEPVYMFNMIDYFDTLHHFEGAPEFSGTPKESNKYYEDHIMKLWLSHASYPMFNGSVQYKNLINIHPEKNYDQVTIARYPNRKTFLKLLADPSYAPYEPYKFMSMQIDLVPGSADMLLPDLRWIVGSLFIFIFMGFGWFRASRRN